jgi:hypothetical protein
MYHRLHGTCLALCLYAAAVTAAAGYDEAARAPSAEGPPAVEGEPPAEFLLQPEHLPASRRELASERAPEPESEPADDLASLLAYSTGLQLAAGRDPRLAARYLAFWHLLSQAADPSQLDEAQAVRIEALLERVGPPAAGRGSGPGGLAALLPGVIAVLSTQRGEALAGSQALLTATDRVLAPRVLVNGRYEFAGRLDDSADLNLASDVWLRCRASPACILLHDRLFAQSMGGVSLGTAATPRLASDAALQSLPGLGRLLEQAEMLDQRLVAAGGTREAAAAAAGAELWQVIGAQAGSWVSGSGPRPDPAELQRLLALGQGSAWLAGSGPLGGAFGIVGRPLLEFAQYGAQGALAGTFIGATAGVGLLLAGAQALAQTSQAAARADAQAPEVSRMLWRLQESTYTGLLGLRSETQLSGNALDVRLVGLGLSLDALRDDVARIESAQRARLRAGYLQQEARRWSAFEEDNERCFSLRSRDAATGRLRPAEYRRCEERLLQGAIRRSQYATRARDYVLDPAFLEPADLRFPFHRHYPLLLSSGGLDTSAALSLADPFEWQQHAAALLRLYQEQPAAPAEFARRREVLRELGAAGQRVHDALAAVVVGPRPLDAPSFQVTTHERVIEAHFQSLEQLVARVGTLDEPEADPYGKRLTAGLDQPLPDGQRRAALEERLAGLARGGRGLGPCSDAAEVDFIAGEQALRAETRRWFGSPITAEEVAQGWSRGAVSRFGLHPGSVTAWLTRPVTWAVLEGLGEVEVCLARLRPASLAFSREESLLRGHRDAQVEIDARIEVRFYPGEPLRRQAGLPDDASLLLAATEATRSCSFAFRTDAGGCSRGACVGQLAGRFWSAGPEEDVNGGRCEGPPLPARLAAAFRRAEPLPDALLEGMEALYWQGRAVRSARLAADARRSSEYVAASASALHYFALATVTVAAWPDPGSPLLRLFGVEGRLSPRAVVADLVETRRPPETLRAELAAERERLMQWVRERGQEVEQPGALYRMPQMQGLREALTRVELAQAAYSGAGHSNASE